MRGKFSGQQIKTYVASFSNTWWLKVFSQNSFIYGDRRGAVGDIPYQHHQLQTRLAGQENDVQWLTETYISCSEITEDRALPGGRNPHLNL